jgi:NAD+ synthase (glutamine-hydrolysing)
MLRKSKARGFFLPLSGGLDSCAVALIVYNMCYLLYQQINNSADSQQILQDLRKVLKDKDYTPQNPHEMCSRILFTAYLATENSSETTRARAKKIS